MALGRVLCALLLSVLYAPRHATGQEFTPDPSAFELCPLPKGGLPVALYPSSGDIVLEWQSFNLYGTNLLRIDVLLNGSFLLRAATAAPNSGRFVWSANDSYAPGEFRFNVTSIEQPDIFARSEPFELLPPSAASRDPFSGASAFNNPSSSAYPLSSSHLWTRHQSLYRWQEVFPYAGNSSAPLFILTQLSFNVGARPARRIASLKVGLAFVNESVVAFSNTSAFLPTITVFSRQDVSNTEFNSDVPFNITLPDWPWLQGRNLVVEVLQQMINTTNQGGMRRVEGNWTLRAITARSNENGTAMPATNLSFASESENPMSVRFVGRPSAEYTDCANVTEQVVPHRHEWIMLDGSNDPQQSCGAPGRPSCRYDNSLAVWSRPPANQGAADRIVLVVFGGLQIGQRLRLLNDVWLFHVADDDAATTAGVWEMVSEVSCRNPALPACRFGHSSAVLGSQLYVFGGEDFSEGLMTGDLWRFDLLAQSWEIVAVPVTPRGTTYHSMATNGADSIWVHGGDGYFNGTSDRVQSSQVLHFNVTSASWSLVGDSVANPAVPLNRINTSYCVLLSSDTPTAPCLYAAVMAFVSRSVSPYLLVHGGVVYFSFNRTSVSQSIFDDSNALYRFDIVAGRWTLLQASDCSSPQRPPCRLWVYGALRDDGGGRLVFMVAGGEDEEDEEGSGSDGVWQVDIRDSTGEHTPWLRVAPLPCAQDPWLSCRNSFGVAAVNETVFYFGGLLEKPGLTILYNSVLAYTVVPRIISQNLSLPLPQRPTDGRVSMRINGTGFGRWIGDVRVRLQGPFVRSGEDLCDNVTFVEPPNALDRWRVFDIVCDTPPGVGANVSLSVATRHGAWMRSAPSRLLSYAPPVVISVEFERGAAPTVGGGRVRVRGAQFGGAVDEQLIEVGEGLCENVTWISSSELECDAPPGKGAGLAVAVTVGAQRSVVTNVSAVYSYDPPTISDVRDAQNRSLASASVTFAVDGGEELTVLGTNFGSHSASSPLLVRIGSAACTVLSADDDAGTLRCVIPAGAGANNSITVVSENQESLPAVAKLRYRAPVVTSVEFEPAPVGGGSRLTIRGANFSPNPLCTASIGIAPCAATQRENSTQIICIVPPAGGQSQSLSVAVACGDQRSAPSSQALFGYAQPLIVSVTWSPPVPTTGGTVLTVRGSQLGVAGFPPSLRIGGLPCALAQWISSTEMRCVVGAGAGAGLSVTASLAGQVAEGAQRFAFDPPQLFTVISRGSSTEGGYEVELRGRNFGPPETSNVTVSLGATSCPLTVHQDHELVLCRAPPGVGANLSVVITVAGQSSGASSATFSYGAPVVSVLSLSRTSFSTAGGELVTIRGGNFGPPSAGARVWLGPFECSNLSRVSHDELVCSTPEGFGKDLQVAVEAAGQRSSGGSTVPRFSYASPTVLNVSLLATDAALVELDSTVLDIRGLNFGPQNGTDRSIRVGEALCANVTWRSHSQLLCSLPAAGAGAGLAVTVRLGGQVSAPVVDENGRPVSSSLFSFPPPLLQSLSPTRIRLGAGVRVTLAGSNFGLNVSQISVDVGGLACRSVSILVGGELVECSAPELNRQGTLAVTLVAAGQRSNALLVSYHVQDVADGAAAAMITLAALVELALLVLIVLVYRLRRNPVIRASSVLFCIISIFGAMVGVAAVFTLRPPEYARVCNLAWFLIVLGFTLMYMSVLLKNYRILRVFTNKTLTTKVHTDGQLLTYLAGFVVLDVLFLLPFSVANSCTVAISGTALGFAIVLFIYKALSLVAGVVIAFRSRVIHLDRFSERQQLGYAIYNVAFSILFVLPVAIFLSTDTDGIYIVRCMGILVIASVTMAVLFAPKLYAAHGEEALNSSFTFSASLGPSLSRPGMTGSSSSIDLAARGRSRLSGHSFESRPSHSESQLLQTSPFHAKSLTVVSQLAVPAPEVPRMPSASESPTADQGLALSRPASARDPGTANAAASLAPESEVVLRPAPPQEGQSLPESKSDELSH